MEPALLFKKIIHNIILNIHDIISKHIICEIFINLYVLYNIYVLISLKYIIHVLLMLQGMVILILCDFLHILEIITEKIERLFLKKNTL